MMGVAQLAHNELMLSLADKHRQIAQVIGDRTVSFIDVPLYRNVGDLLILQGTLAFFRRHNINVRYMANWFNAASNKIGRTQVVVFQGGGNLGDLYFGSQSIREKLIPQHLDKRVVILPQSIHFDSEQNYRNCCSLFAKHPDLHIFVRDEASYALAKQMTTHVYLMPDMAHQLYPINSSKKAGKSVLGILRQDKEALELPELETPDTLTDWNLLFNKRDSLMLFLTRCAKLGARLAVNTLPIDVVTRLGLIVTDSLVRDAVSLYAQHETVVTDRLHGHILACLMNKPHTVMDNCYGKNSRYMSLWTGPSPLVNRIEKGNFDV